MCADGCNHSRSLLCCSRPPDIISFMEPRINKTRSYDFFCMLKGTLAREASEEALFNLASIIEREGGEFLHGPNSLVSGAENHNGVPILRTRRLAYPIQRETNALTATLEFEGLPDLPQRLREALRYNPHILRYTLTQKVKRARKMTKARSPSLRMLRNTPAALSETPSALTAQPAGAPAAATPPEINDASSAPLSAEDIDKRIEEIIG